MAQLERLPLEVRNYSALSSTPPVRIDSERSDAAGINAYNHDQPSHHASADALFEAAQDAELSLFSESGHSPFYEEPLRFGSELAAFASAAVSSSSTQDGKGP